jgi:hypothetical protein
MKAHNGVELKRHSFLTSALRASDQLRAPAAGTPGNYPAVPTKWEAGWVPEQVLNLWK